MSKNFDTELSDFLDTDQAAAMKGNGTASDTEMRLLTPNSAAMAKDSEHPKVYGATHDDSEDDARLIRCGADKAKYLAECAATKQKPQTFCDNEIKTSKYTLIPFSPHFLIWKNLFEQFQRAANCYFMFIAILQLIPGISPTGRYTTIMPLAFVLTLSLCKDAYEDFKRHMLDKELNNSSAKALRDGKWTNVFWKDIVVGDLLYLKKGLPFPADLVIISSSEPEGLCYIETSSLDGETNLKIRKSVSATYAVFDPDHPENFSCTITSEQPNNKLYVYSGTMILNGQRSPINNESILLRGAALRNTHAAYGIAVFTGAETKLMKNSSQKKHKMSNMDHITNRQVLYIFLFQLTLSFGCSIGLGIFTASSSSHWYLADPDNNVAQTAALGYLTFLILFNNLIPISLYVSMEMVKLVQAYLMNSDVTMYHAATDTPALARTSALNEELGQVSYVFSDKTGTLTCNIMDFLKFSCITADGLQAVSYGTGITEIARSAATREGKVLVDHRPADYVAKDGFAFYDPKVHNGAWAKEPNAARIREFLCHLAVCHTVVAEDDEKRPGTTIYQAASPDEGCLVKAARELGAVFIDRTEQSVTIEVLGEKMTYELLDIIEFDSTRKRMSVIVRDPSGKLQLLCKGADSVIYERLKPGVMDAVLDKTLEMLTVFAAEGLRTLVIAKADISEEYYADWAKRYEAASCALIDRARKMAEVGEEIEKDLILLGSTAIEDKLQDQVPATIELLMAGGVKVWVLTGDKQETAINIGYACALLNNDMTMMCFDDETEATVGNKLSEFYDAALVNINSTNASDMSLVIQGGLLHAVLESPDISHTFLRLATLCKAVICCRVSPLQKAQVVSLVKDNIGSSITLAIGDGANDVSMIQSANVGIGISGLEGLQAARASDYSIAQFKFLQQLLFVHGRWNYRRISRLILYSFYKNIGLYLTQFWFCVVNGFSGQSLYDQWALALYNVWFTAFPIMVVAVLDRDIEKKRILDVKQFPDLYHDGLTNRLFNTKTFWIYTANAIFHSMLAFFIPAGALWDAVEPESGYNLDIACIGVLCYSVTLAIVTAKVGLETLTWTVGHVVVIACSLGIWFAFIFVYGRFWEFAKVTAFAFWYGVPPLIVPTALFWLTCVITIAVALFRDFVYKYYRRNVRPELSHIIQVYEDKFDGNFNRTHVAQTHPELLAKLETLEPKLNASKFTSPRLSHKTGFAFAQEEGQADITRVLSRAITALSSPFSKNRSGSTASKRSGTSHKNFDHGANRARAESAATVSTARNDDAL